MPADWELPPGVSRPLMDYFHNADIARIGDRVVRFADGHIRSIEANEQRIPPAELTW